MSGPDPLWDRRSSDSGFETEEPWEAPSDRAALDDAPEEATALLPGTTEAAAAEPSGEGPSPRSGRLALPTGVARGLRIHDSFPRLPAVADVDVLVHLCVSDEGSVSDARFDRGVVDQFHATLRNAILTWRYRPFEVNGTPTPFCHVMRITYGTN